MVALLGSFGSGTSNSSSTSVSCTTTQPINPGDLIFAFIGFDNLSATTPTVTDVSVSLGPIFSSVATFNAATATAAASNRGSLFSLGGVASTIASGTTVTAQFSAAVTAKVLLLIGFSGTKGFATGTTVFASSAAGIPSATYAGTLAVGDLLVCGAYWEDGTNLPILPANATGGAYLSAGTVQIGTGAAGQSLRACYKIVNTGGSSWVGNPTGSGVDAGVIVAGVQQVVGKVWPGRKAGMNPAVRSAARNAWAA